MVYKHTKISLAVIYHGSPERFCLALTARPGQLVSRRQSVSRKKVMLGFSYRFDDSHEGLDIMKAAERLLSKTDGQPYDGWFSGSVSRACRAIDQAIEREQAIRRRRQAQGHVIGRLRVQRVHAILNEVE